MIASFSGPVHQFSDHRLLVLPKVDFDKLLQFFIDSGNSHQFRGSGFPKSLDDALTQSCRRRKSNQNFSIITDHSREVKHLGRDMGERQERYLMNIILEILDKCDRWPFSFLVRILLLFFKSVFDFPEPTHVVVGKHDTFGVGSCAAGIKEIAAHSRFLFDDSLNDYSVVDIFSEFQKLGPVVDFDLFV